MLENCMSNNFRDQSLFFEKQLILLLQTNRPHKQQSHFMVLFYIVINNFLVMVMDRVQIILESFTI